MPVFVIVVSTSLIGLAFLLAIIRLFYSPYLFDNIIITGWLGVTFALSLLLLVRGTDIKNFLLVVPPFLVAPIVICWITNVICELFERLKQNKLDKKERLKWQRRNYYASLSLEEKKELENKNASDMANYEGSPSYQEMMKKVKK